MEFDSITDATVSIDEAIAERERIRSDGKTFVLTNGCFDLFHAGHANSLNNASKFGDYLWVAINSDESIGRLKGKMRPIIKQSARSYLVQSLECVSGVFVFDTDRLTNEILQLKPDIYVKSDDYSFESIDPEERAALLQVHSSVKFVPLISGFSTTDIISRVKKS